MNSNIQNVQLHTPVGDNADVLVDSTIVEAPLPDIVTGADDRFKQYLTHPVKINHTDWTGATTSALISNDIIDLFKTSLPTSIRSKLANLMYFQAGIKIQIVVQGQAQCYGQMVVAFTPRLKASTEDEGITPDKVVDDNNIVNLSLIHI